MLDIGWPEFAVILFVALLVIGPRDLPKALYTAGKWVRSARKVAREFQRHVDDAMREAELEDLKKGVDQARKLNVKKQIGKLIDPEDELKDAFDPKAGTPPVKKGQNGAGKDDKALAKGDGGAIAPSAASPAPAAAEEQPEVTPPPAGEPSEPTAAEPRQ